jgi:hypothetical protein
MWMLRASKLSVQASRLGKNSRALSIPVHHTVTSVLALWRLLGVWIDDELA